MDNEKVVLLVSELGGLMEEWGSRSVEQQRELHNQLVELSQKLMSKGAKSEKEQERLVQELNRLLDKSSRREVELGNLLEHINRGYTGLHTMWNQKVAEAGREGQELKSLRLQLAEFVENHRWRRWEWGVMLVSAVVLASMVGNWASSRSLNGMVRIEQEEWARLKAMEMQSGSSSSWCESLSSAENERALQCWRQSSNPSSEQPPKQDKTKSGKKKR